MTDPVPPPQGGSTRRRAEQINAFRSEMEQLRRDRVVDLDEATLGAIERYHERVLGDLPRESGTDTGERGRYLGLGMRTFATLGALAFVASTFYFLHQIWGRIGTLPQVAILAAGPLLSLAGTELVARRDPTRYFTGLMALLALACFIVSTLLIPATFNAPFPSPVLAGWAGLALLLAYAYGLRLPLILGAALAAVSPLAMVLEAGGADWPDGIFERVEGLMPAGAALFLLPDRFRHDRRSGFAEVWRLTGLFFLFFPMFVVTRTAQSLLPVAPEAARIVHEVGGLLAAAGAVLLGVARRHREVVTGGTLAFTALLLSAMVEWFWDLMPRYLFFLTVSVCALIILAILRRLFAALPGTAAGEAPA